MTSGPEIQEDSILESAWSKATDPEAHLSKEEAAHIWDEVHQMAASVPNGQRIIWLYDQLGRELAKGERCPVCGDHKNPECATEC